MPLSDGTRLGPYEILAPLGAGGMGEVYRAADTRLKRQVAIKVLPAALADDPGRLARFQREAEVLASLNHPHIAAIYGLEDSAGLNALVMELVDGPTLADRIAQGALPPDEALPIARQIADALDAAHGRGIVHRDLKPANVKVRDDGTVKVLDFGLAKLAETNGAGTGWTPEDPAQSPTMTSPAVMTAMGAILGTAAYMSPEQARGKAVDKRTDIWAFGAVLYEMLAGIRAFAGDDIAEVIASVLKTTPDWTRLPDDVPPAIVTLVQRCLEKDRNARVTDMAVARFLLSDQATIGGAPLASGSRQALPAPASGSGPGQTNLAAAAGAAAAGAASTAADGAGRPHGGGRRARVAADLASAAAGAAASATSGAAARSGWRAALPWMLAAAVAGALAGAGLAALAARRSPLSSSAARPVARLQMSVAPADQLVPSVASPRPARTAFALSPDGRQLVFSGTRAGATQLYLRPLDRADATPLSGTAGAVAPFFSPDGAWIVFHADGKLRKVPVAGGAAATICDVPPGGGLGASWDSGDTILFATDDGIARVPAAGGTPETVVRRDAAKPDRLLLPHALPDGSILFTSVGGTDWAHASLVLQTSERGGARRVLLEGGADARYVGAGAGTGHLVYVSGGVLMGVPFDARSHQVAGAPVALADSVLQAVNAANSSDETGAGQFAIAAAAGTLAYAPGGPFSQREGALVWVDRAGGAAQAIDTAPAAAYLGPRLSPDGRKLAVAVRRASPRGIDVWVYDLSRGAPARLTFEGYNAQPVWSPDGRRIVYSASGRGAGANADGLFIANADGSGTPERIGDNGNPVSWSAAAHAIALRRRLPDGSSEIVIQPLDGDRRQRRFLQSPFTLQFPELSPDGRWLAYLSNESGAYELYVQSYPGPGEKTRVSTSGAFEPIWTRDGGELLYRGTGASRGFFSAAVHAGVPFRVDPPRRLFDTKPGEYDSTMPERSWDVSADARRFLLTRPGDSADKPVTALQIVLNWTAELERLAPAK